MVAIRHCRDWNYGMTPEVKNILTAAGVAPGTVSENDLERLVKFVVLTCMNECRQVSYEAMDIELDIDSPLLEYERGSRAGRKFSALDCLRRLSDRFDVTAT